MGRVLNGLNVPAHKSRTDERGQLFRLPWIVVGLVIVALVVQQAISTGVSAGSALQQLETQTIEPPPPSQIMPPPSQIMPPSQVIRPPNGTSWMVERYGYRYLVKSVERTSDGGGSPQTQPSLVINGILTQTQSDGLSMIEFTIFDQDGNLLEETKVTGEKDPPLNQPSNLGLVVRDHDPRAQSLVIHIRNWYWQGRPGDNHNDLILRVSLA